MKQSQSGEAGLGPQVSAPWSAPRQGGREESSRDGRSMHSASEAGEGTILAGTQTYILYFNHFWF